MSASRVPDPRAGSCSTPAERRVGGRGSLLVARAGLALAARAWRRRARRSLVLLALASRCSYATMICCTSGWRTTSTSVNVQNAMPSMPREELARLGEAAAGAVREVDLGDVAGDHRLRGVAEAREEHAHLLARRVLRLVEDDEAVVQRAAAHEGERRDLDLAARDRPSALVDVHHVVERVVERAQIRVHFLGEVARAGSRVLAGLDRRAREDDALDARSSSACTAIAMARYVFRCPRGRCRT